MEEQKVQALHDTLSKLKRSAGLGVASHYNFGGVKTKQDANGQTVREDGLPNNPLYFPFVKAGTYDPSKGDASKYGDGRVIKRNFDDSKPGSLTDECDVANGDGSKSKTKKKLSKAEKKEAKRQAKIEAKRQAKLEVGIHHAGSA